MEILLLVATLGAVVQCLMGLVAKANRWERYFQANTERKRRVLSIVFVGNELMRSERFKPSRAELDQALKRLVCHLHREAIYG